MCKSVRGAAFFGSSMHMAFSFVFLFWFVFDTLISEININLWKCDPPEPKFSHFYPLAHYLNLLFKLLYFIGLSITGVYIFRGVEREKAELLKYATLAFAIIQMIGVVLFAIFFSIQWYAELDHPPEHKSNIQAAQLVSEDVPVGESPVIIPPISLPEALNETSNGDQGKPSMNCCARTVTPLVSENVLEAPDIHNITTTTTPMAPPLMVQGEVDTTTTTTTTPATVTTNTTTSTTTAPAIPPCITAECLHAQIPPIIIPPPKKLPHNLLVRLVLQMCFAVFNGLISVAYIIVLALYMLKM